MYISDSMCDYYNLIYIMYMSDSMCDYYNLIYNVYCNIIIRFFKQIFYCLLFTKDMVEHSKNL